MIEDVSEGTFGDVEGRTMVDTIDTIDAVDMADMVGMVGVVDMTDTSLGTMVDIVKDSWSLLRL